jgi:chromosomal replication initiation ATPase DnaA
MSENLRKFHNEMSLVKDKIKSLTTLVHQIEQRAISQGIITERVDIPLPDQINKLARNMGYTIAEVKSSARVKPLPDVRMIIAFIMVKERAIPLTYVANFINKDHSSIIRALRNFPDYYEQDENVKYLYNQAKKNEVETESVG